MNKQELEKYPKDWIIDELILVIKTAESLDLEITKLRKQLTLTAVVKSLATCEKTD
jgi:hypothetical protein